MYVCICICICIYIYIYIYMYMYIYIYVYIWRGSETNACVHVCMFSEKSLYMRRRSAKYMEAVLNVCVYVCVCIYIYIYIHIYIHIYIYTYIHMEGNKNKCMCACMYVSSVLSSSSLDRVCPMFKANTCVHGQHIHLCVCLFVLFLVSSRNKTQHTAQQN